MDKDRLRRNVEIGARSLLEQYGESWGVAHPHYEPTANGVFFSARSVWALCTAVPSIARHGHTQELDRIGQIAEGELAFLVNHGSDPSRKGQMSWYSADTTTFEPVKSTAAAVEALLAAWCCWEQLRIPATSPLRRAGLRDAILGGVAWLCDKQAHADTAHSFTSHEGSTYHLVPLPGWQTIPEELYEQLYPGTSSEAQALEEKIGTLMGHGTYEGLRQQPLWCGLRYDCRATKEAMLVLALARRCEGLDLPSSLGRSIDDTLARAFHGLERAISVDGWWSEIVCDNTFAVLALLLSLPFQEQHLMDNVLSLAHRGLERTPRDRALRSKDVCILNSYVWVSYLLGHDTDAEAAALGEWIESYLDAMRSGNAEPFRPDYLSWLVVTQSRLYEDSDADLRREIASRKPEQSDVAAPPPRECINRLARLASLLSCSAITVLQVGLLTGAGLLVKRLSSSAIALAVTPAVAIPVLGFTWTRLRRLMTRQARRRLSAGWPP